MSEWQDKINAAAIEGRQILSPTIKVGNEAVKLNEAGEDVQAKIKRFNNFLDTKPLLGENFKDSLAKDAVDFALLYTSSHPELINQIVALILEQNKNNPIIKQELAQRLVDFNNNHNPDLNSALNIESHIKKLDPKNKGSTLTALSSKNRLHLLNVAAKMADKQKLIAGNLSGTDLKSLHNSYQALQSEWHKIPNNMRPAIIAGVIMTTDHYLNKQVGSGDLQAISDVAAVIAKSKAFMGYRNYKDQKDLEKRLENATMENVLKRIESHPELLDNVANSNNKLSAEHLNALAPFYNPAIHSAKFLQKFLDSNYSKGMPTHEFYNKVELGLHQANMTGSAAFQNALKDYLDIKRLHEAKPFLTRVKAMLTGKSLKNYKQNILERQAVALKNALISEQDNNRPKSFSLKEAKEEIRLKEQESQKRIAAAKQMSAKSESAKFWGGVTGNRAKVVTAVNSNQQQHAGITPSSNRSNLSSKEQINLVNAEAQNRLNQNKPKAKQFKISKYVKKVKAALTGQNSGNTSYAPMDKPAAQVKQTKKKSFGIF